MSKRDYGQFCGLSRALELVGERWALLIVRDLLVGPKRYTDLRQGLPRIPTNVLAARLKELEDAQVIRRRALPRPASGVVYELTGYGAELEEVVLRLGRWGAQALGQPGPHDIVTVDSLIMALRSTFRRDTALGRDVSYELRIGALVVHASVRDGELAVGAGAANEPDLVIECGPVLKALMAREITPEQAVESGRVRIEGKPKLLARFVDMFRI